MRSLSSNPRTIAQLFKLELAEMFNQWERVKPLRTGASHASAILQSDADWCLRRQVLLACYPEQAQHPEQKPWSTLENARFLNGWQVHEKYQKLFSDHAKVLEVEQSHYDETRFLHFTPDAVIQFGADTFVVEIKGYKAETYAKLDEMGKPPEAARHQCNLYCHLLGIEYGLILVENKNTQEYKIWCIEHDLTLARGYLDRMYCVKKAVMFACKKQKLPERACTSCKDRRAEKCPMKDFCFSGRLEQ